MKTLLSLFCFPHMSRVRNGMAFAVSQELFQTYVDTSLLAGRNVFDAPLCIKRKLDVVAIGTFDEPDTFDLLRGKFFNPLVFASYQPQAAYVATISEGDVLAIGGELPARLLVLHRTVIMLEARIALFPWLVGLAVVIEARDSEPRALRSRLTGLRIELRGKGKGLCQLSTSHVEIIAGDTTGIHPQAQALVSDELCDPYRFINRLIAGFVSTELVLNNQHQVRLCLSIYFCIVSWLTKPAVL